MFRGQTMRNLVLAMTLEYSVSACTEAHLIEYDQILNGVVEQVQTMDIKLLQRGAVLSGTSQSNGVIVGNIEQLNDLHAGSGSERRFFFKLDDNGELKWFTGGIHSTTWTGVWFGENGERGDFNLRRQLHHDGENGERGDFYLQSTATSNELPTASDVMKFSADDIFSGGVFDTYNTINADFLNNRYGLEPLPYEQVDYKKGIFVQSDNGGLPFPMSFELTFIKEFTLRNFRLGSFHNRENTRLTTFDFDIWSNGDWVKAGSFTFSAITQSRHWQKQAFSLPQEVTTRKVRISATGTADYYNGGRVLMWGLTFHK